MTTSTKAPCSGVGLHAGGFNNCGNCSGRSRCNRGNKRLTFDGLLDSRPDILPLLAAGGNVAANPRKDLGAPEGAKAAGNLLAHVNHPEVLLGLIVEAWGKAFAGPRPRASRKTRPPPAIRNANFGFSVFPRPPEHKAQDQES